MKAIILAAGQGTRLRPLTDNQPKCMVEVQNKSIIRHQLETMKNCNISEEDIYVVCGYQQGVLRQHLSETHVNFVYNEKFETTNMVCSLMCAKQLFNDTVIVSYGDIIYTPIVLQQVVNSPAGISVVVDDSWYGYWKSRCEDPLSDAETLKFDKNGNIKEIGQKAGSLVDIESQYIGLMKFNRKGASCVLKLCQESERRSELGVKLWCTDRDYSKMYMTDLLQGLADEGNQLVPIHINRGWFEVDCLSDLAIAQSQL